MIRVYGSRRTITAIIGIIALVVIALVKGVDTSTAIASIAIAVAGANAVQGGMGSRGGKDERHIDDAT